MKDFLQKIKLIEYLTLELNIQKEDFITFLEQKVDDGSPSALFQVFDLFSFSKKIFKGRINSNGFEIRKKRKFFQSNNFPSIVNGKFQAKNDKLYLAIEINGFPKQMMFFLVISIVFYILIFGSLFIGSEADKESLIVLPIFLLFMLISAAISYFLMKKNVKQMKELLENELLNQTSIS